jgi:predicted nucleotidyltransferase
VRVFGSHARDKATSESDVDLIVDLSRPLGLEFFTIQNELSERPGLHVEMFTEAELASDIKRTALADAIDA